MQKMPLKTKLLAARTALFGAALIGAAAHASAARAQTAPTVPQQTGLPANPASAAAEKPADKPYVAPKNLSEWASSIKLGFQIEGGITGNPDDPRSRRNFGRLFDDNSNRPVLNQAMVTIGRDVDPKATSVDVGFKLQAFYGSDARIVHTLGVFDQLIHDRNQLTVTEASISVRLPDLFAGGLDIKAGMYPTPLGFELIDPKSNPFYSHSYIFNYGLPFKHVGALATAHVSDTIDLYLGIDSGTNTGVGYGGGDNNNRPAGIAGIGYNAPGGKFTVLALTHMGPENSKRNTPFANEAMRYYNDVVITWKTTDKLTLTTELNYVQEDGFNANAYGAAFYASYALSDTLTLNGRAEVFRDNQNFFVSTPVAERDFANFERGVFSRFITSTRAGTYSGLTAGVTYKPSGMPSYLSTLMVRPEIRYDRTLNGARPFNDGRRRDMVTLATDVVVGF